MAKKSAAAVAEPGNTETGNAAAPEVAAEWLPIEAVHPWKDNPRQNAGAVADVAASIKRFGFGAPIVARKADGEIIAGHTRYAAAQSLGLRTVPVRFMDLDPAEAHVLALADNKLGELATWDDDALKTLLGTLGADVDLLGGTGFTAAEIATLTGDAGADGGGPHATPGPSLADRFGVPPFSVLDARQGVWQDRKREWLALGFDGARGRGDALTTGRKAKAKANGSAEVHGNAAAWAAAHKPLGLTPVATGVPGGMSDALAPRGKRGKNARNTMASDRAMGLVGGFGRAANGSARQRRGPDGRRLTWAAGDRPLANSMTRAPAMRGATSSGTSIFDPVLCELICRWFCPKGGTVVDPFAGGCTLGIVAARLGHRYIGCEFRPEQIAANVPQAAAIKFPGEPPEWRTGSSVHLAEVVPEADLILTDPPYWNLEVYSDRQGDGSTERTYPAFLAWYETILAAAMATLRDDRFFVVKIGDVRDASGHYVGLIGDTIDIAQRLGMYLYNEFVLLTALGSLPVRTSRAFVASRKVGRAHQTVLVFVKGSAKKATAACGPIDVVEWGEGDDASPSSSLSPTG